MEPLTPASPAVPVRAALIERYQYVSHALPEWEPRSWLDRVDALRAGETVIEPGWILRQVVDEAFDVYGLYRVYPDGRIERDRHVERAQLDRFRGAR